MFQIGVSRKYVPVGCEEPESRLRDVLQIQRRYRRAESRQKRFDAAEVGSA
jgi:hypothetical protein